MTKTSWIRSSRTVAFALVALLALSVAAPAAAVSVGDSSVPNEGQVGTQVSATVTLTELYQNPQLEQWTLEGETELTNVTWTVSYFDQTGSKVSQESFDGQSFNSSQIAANDGVSEVTVKVTGTVPQVANYTYPEEEKFLMMRLVQSRQGGSSNDIDAWQVHHFTQNSKAARQALDDAQSAIDSTSAGTADAEETFDAAIDAYANANFDNAERLADRAAEQAQSAQQSQQTFQYALYAVGGLVVVGLLVGGFLWYRSQQDTYDKLG